MALRRQLLLALPFSGTSFRHIAISRQFWNVHRGPLTNTTSYGGAAAATKDAIKRPAATTAHTARTTA